MATPCFVQPGNLVEDQLAVHAYMNLVPRDEYSSSDEPCDGCTKCRSLCVVVRRMLLVSHDHGKLLVMVEWGYAAQLFVDGAIDRIPSIKFVNSKAPAGDSVASPVTFAEPVNIYEILHALPHGYYGWLTARMTRDEKWRQKNVSPVPISLSLSRLPVSSTW